MKIEAVSPPSAAEVRAALERIAKSPELRGSFRLIAFLRYVVELTLVGQFAQIKGYTIAVEALGRDPSFDPQANPIVRVEAGRLRRALANYYENAGSNDPIVIDLPRGSYVPLFCERGFAGDRRNDRRSTFQTMSEHLMELRRQIDEMSAEIKIAERMWSQSDHAQRRDA